VDGMVRIHWTISPEYAMMPVSGARTMAVKYAAIRHAHNSEHPELLRGYGLNVI